MTEYTGFDALVKLGDYLQAHMGDLLEESAYRGAGYQRKRHPTIARGTGEASVKELMEKAPHLAFGGALHAIVRNTAYRFGQMLDVDALPEPQKQAIDCYQRNLADYQAQTDYLMSLLPEPTPTYTNFDSLSNEIAFAQFDDTSPLNKPETKKKIAEALAIASDHQEQWSLNKKELIDSLNALQHVPLKLITKDAAGKEMTLRTIVSNRITDEQRLPTSLAGILFLNQTIKKGQYSSLAQPRMINDIGENSSIVHQLQHTLVASLISSAHSSQNPIQATQSQAMLQLMDDKLNADLTHQYTHNVQRLFAGLVEKTPNAARGFEELVAKSHYKSVALIIKKVKADIPKKPLPEEYSFGYVQEYGAEQQSESASHSVMKHAAEAGCPHMAALLRESQSTGRGK